MIGWNDILGGFMAIMTAAMHRAKEKLSESTIIQFWTGDPEIVTQAVLKGHDVVNSYWSNTYLDYDYKTIPLAKAYNFNPVPAACRNLHHKILGIGYTNVGRMDTYRRKNELPDLSQDSSHGRSGLDQ